MKKLKSLLFVFLILSFNLGLCDEITWTGAGSNNKWDNPDNWDGGKVPGKPDNVTIPANTPECNVDHARVNNLFNNGTISTDNCVAGMLISAEGTISNYGTISSPARVFLSADEIQNQPSGTIQGTYCFGNTAAVDLWAIDKLKNWGDIKGLQGGGGGGYRGGGVSICTGIYSEGNGEVSNYGQITGADGAVTGDGGDVFINTGILENSGTIASGNGAHPDLAEDGKVTIRAAKIDNEGTIKGGKSDTKGIGKVSGHDNISRDIIMGDVSLYADSIFLHPDTNYIEGKILGLYCHYLNINNVNNFAGIWTTEGVHIYITGDGTSDFSGVDQVSAIFSENNDGNHIYANNIIEPPQGLSYIFSPNPEINPSDTTITGGHINCNNDFNDPGITDTLDVYMQNLSMLPKVLNYSISSDLGWVETVSANSPQLEPFEFENIQLQYTIPEGTIDRTTDTVQMILTIGSNFADTSFCLIECIHGEYHGIPENGFKNKKVLYQNYPNPFSHNTTIGYFLNEDGKVTLELYNHTGRKISLLVDKFQTKGYHEINFSRKSLVNGIYYYVLKQNGDVSTCKSLVIMP